MKMYEDLYLTGDILLCSGGNYPLSKLIQSISDSHYSHVAFVMWIHDRLMVLGSVENAGVRTVPLSSYLTANIILCLPSSDRSKQGVEPDQIRQE
ncbi:hypothetical protein BK124_02925 [Paenibacillus amylolyticus]|nr:hypothetical protein BK124_02925 [Paenibacillus amylolyticus]OMF07475.1 hypothetical protein BK129_06620 [Paenibacillus amylolyticus]